MSRGYCSGCLQPAVCEARGGCQGPIQPLPSEVQISDALRLLQEASCFGHEVCPALPCHCAEIIAALAAAQAPKVTDGYVLVPRKITIAMIAAGWAAFRRDKPPVQLLGPGKGFVEAWEAMLAASPLSSAHRWSDAK